MSIQNQNNGMSCEKDAKNSSSDMIALVEKKIYFLDDDDKTVMKNNN